MKVAMTFTIEHTLCVLLHLEDNASALVNRLLEQHFKQFEDNFDQKIAKNKQNIKEIKQNKADFDQKERKTYHRLLLESKRRNTELTREMSEELNYLHGKFGGVDVFAKTPI